MASFNVDVSASTNDNIPGAAGRTHQRTKSSVLKSFIHRRNNSDGTALPPSDLLSQAPTGRDPSPSRGREATKAQHTEMGYSKLGRAPPPLGELHQNQQEQAMRSPKKSQDELHNGRQSPKKSTFPTLFKSQTSQDASSSKLSRKRDTSPEKPKKTKSSTNLAGLLSRPKSIKGLHKLMSEDDINLAKDKENRTPPASLGEDSVLPPIYAQFSKDAMARQTDNPSPTGGAMNDPFSMLPGDHPAARSANSSASSGFVSKPRPKSFQPPPNFRYNSTPTVDTVAKDSKMKEKEQGGEKRSSTWGKEKSTTRARLASAFPGMGSRTKSATSLAAAAATTEPTINPEDIDKHLEAMLDRRNIPEHQRYKMRNLNSTIKLEFIRQDWAETQAKAAGRPPSHDSSDGSIEVAEPEQTKSKHSRIKSMTLSKGGSKTTTKKKFEGTLGRHFRSKSTESIASERPMSAGSSSTNSIIAKVKQQTPKDFVAYLRQVQKPELVEVGKLHKLRLLLRNETVTWTEEFIRHGGMKEIVGLLHRIMEVEWREEHEDALLHENLLCLKALCTTALALQYLHTIQATLFPALVHMIFDPERKGPSEFTTRGIVFWVLFTYIQSATPQERVDRAQTVLGYLRDPEPKEEDRPLNFILEMRQERPFRVWNKEVVGVTKEVFWIFLHNMNVVSLPADKSTKGGAAISPSTDRASADDDSIDDMSYQTRHFPQERPPVPAAPYVGGVEWDATNYVASHIDLLNAILACTPTSAARNQLRAHMRISGWERCLGGSLRLCKEKFYGAVHDGLRTWVAAAFDDGWEVKDVRYGPPADAMRSPIRKKATAKPDEPAPKLEMPKFDLGDPLTPGETGKADGQWPL